MRRPDGSFVRKGRLPPEQFRRGHFCIAFDLAIEVLSSNEPARKVVEKVEEYLRAGVRLVWVIDPVSRTALVHRADSTTRKLRDHNDLDGEDMFPGFRCTLRDFRPAKLASAGKAAG